MECRNGMCRTQTSREGYFPILSSKVTVCKLPGHMCFQIRWLIPSNSEGPSEASSCTQPVAPGRAGPPRLGFQRSASVLAPFLLKILIVGMGNSLPTPRTSSSSHVDHLHDVGRTRRPHPTRPLLPASAISVQALLVAVLILHREGRRLVPSGCKQLQKTLAALVSVGHGFVEMAFAAGAGSFENRVVKST